MADISCSLTTVHFKISTVHVIFVQLTSCRLQLTSQPLHGTEQSHIFVVFGLRNLTKKKTKRRVGVFYPAGTPQVQHPQKLNLSGVRCKNNHFLGWEKRIGLSVMKKMKKVFLAVVAMVAIATATYNELFAEDVIVICDSGSTCCVFGGRPIPGKLREIIIL